MTLKGRIEPDVSKKLSYNNSDNASREENPPDDGSTSIWFSKRFLVAVVVFLCFANSTMLMFNTNIAVVEMASNKTITVGNTTVVQPAEFQWDTVTVGIVSSIYSYGGLVFVFFGGYFVDKFGGSVTCAMSMMIAGALTVLHPFVLYLDFNLFLGCRFVAGFFLTSFFISTAEIYSRWFPKSERSLLIAIGYNGINAGVVIAYPLFGYIAAEFGWQMVFYVSGIISLFFSLLCVAVVKNRPSQDKRISQDELSYILHGTEDAARKEESHPYKKIFSSTPVLTICIGKFTLMWVNTILSATLPLYIKDMTGKSTDEIGVISSYPTLAQLFISPFAGALLDRWKNSSDMKLTRIHKITISLAFLTSSILFVVAIYLNEFTTSMIFFILIQIVMTVVPPVLDPIIVNLSPNDASVIANLAKFFANISIITSRACFGFMTLNHTSQEWNNCFILSIGVLLFGTVIFAKYASSDVQPWSSSSTPDSEQNRLIKIKYRRRSST